MKFFSLEMGEMIAAKLEQNYSSLNKATHNFLGKQWAKEETKRITGD